MQSYFDELDELNRLPKVVTFRGDILIIITIIISIFVKRHKVVI